MQFENALLSFCKSLWENIDNNYENKYQCFSADPQTGKTKVIIARTIKTMSEGRVPILILRNRQGDSNQYMYNFKEYNKMFIEYLEKYNIDVKYEINCIEGNNIKTFLNSKRIEEAFEGIKPIAIMCLGNIIQLNRIFDITNKHINNYDLIIDEVDYVDCSESGTSKKLKLLKDNAFKVFGITATPIEFMMAENNLTVKDHIRIEPPEDYRGFNDIVYRSLPEKSVGIGRKVNTIDDIFNRDKNLKYFLEYLSNPVIGKHCIGNEEFLPTICLIKNTSVINNQNLIYNYIRKTYKDIVVITYNGEGGKMYFNGMNKKGIKISNKIIYPNEEEKLDIADILQYFKDNGGVDKFSKIVIIAGELAGRCISYVSRDYIWHLTDMYYIPASHTPIPVMIQAIGRLCGRNKGKALLTLYTSEYVINNLHKGISFYSELIDRIKTKEESELICDALSNIPMKKCKIPKKHKLTSKVKPPSILAVNDDEDDKGWDIKKYNDKKIIYLNENNNSELGNEEFIRLTTKMFPKWSNSDIKIARFMQNLDPNKKYTENEFKEECKKYNIISTFLLRPFAEKTKSNYYGQIIKKENEYYYLYPSLLKSFEEYF